MQPVSRLLRISRPQRFATSLPKNKFIRPTPLIQQRRTPCLPFSNPRFSPQTRRYNSSLAVPESAQKNQPPRPAEPSYQLSFTCKPCSHRSTHVITKHGYHKGTVLIQCPNCKSRHVISDHLKIFMDEKSTLEDILQRKAGPDGDLSKLLKKGKLGMRQGELVGREGDEDIEFWDDGTQTKHDPPKA